MTGPRSITAEQYERQIAGAMTEAVLQARTEAAARQLGWLAYHAPDNRPVTARSGRRYVQHVEPGFPDLVLVHAGQGRILYRELKTQGGRIRPEQTRWMGDLEAAGADVGVWRPADLLSGRIVSELRGTV